MDVFTIGVEWSRIAAETVAGDASEDPRDWRRLLRLLRFLRLLRILKFKRIAEAQGWRIEIAAV